MVSEGLARAVDVGLGRLRVRDDGPRFGRGVDAVFAVLAASFELDDQGVTPVDDALARPPPEVVVGDVPREELPLERAPLAPGMHAEQDRGDDGLEGVLALAFRDLPRDHPRD